MGHLSKASFYHFLSMSFGAHRECVLKVNQVSQAVDGQVRYDLFIVHENVSVVNISCLLTLSRFLNAHIRAHIPYSLRSHPSAHPNVSLYSLDSLSVISLNVNGISKKRDEFSFFLTQAGVDVALLQETHRSANEVNHKPVWLQGFNVIEVSEVGSGDARGLAIAVRNGIQARHLPFVSPTSHCMAVEVRGPYSSVVFVSVYIPSQKRKEGMAALSNALAVIATRRPNAAVVVGGDFNASVKHPGVVSLLNNGNMSPVPFSTSPLTYHRNLKSISAIDFFVVNEVGHSLDSFRGKGNEGMDR
jgi:hypothetical protein